MTFLEVTRATGWWGLTKPLMIEMDGDVVLVLSRRATRTVQVQPGRHTVVARADWASSPPFEVTCAQNETTRVEVVALPPGSLDWRVPFVWFRINPGLVYEVRVGRMSATF